MTNPTCTDVRLELVAYLDGELTETARAQVEAHLAGCAVCESERQALDGVWSALDHLPGLEARPGWLAELEANVLAEAAAGGAVPVEAAPAPAGTVFKLPWAMAAAAGLLIAGGIAWWASADRADEQLPQVAPAMPAPRVQSPEAPGVRVPKQDLVPDVKVPERDPSRYDVPHTPDTPDTPRRRESPAIAQREREQLQRELAKLDPIERKVVENLQALAMLEDREDRDVMGNLDLLDDMDEDELDEG